jgi:uncharacterized protein YndB with AHSA1/START domain
MKVERQGDTIFAELEIEAPPGVVFAALVDPVQLPLWWGTPDTYQTSNWQVDPRVGGKWSYEIRSAKDAHLKTIQGVYEEFDPPRAMTFTWNRSWEEKPLTRVRITLEPTPTGTLLRLVHSGFGDYERAAQEHTQGWTRVLGWLDRYCQAMVAGGQ